MSFKQLQGFPFLVPNVSVYTMLETNLQAYLLYLEIFSNHQFFSFIKYPPERHPLKKYVIDM
jgi:hypothetical protein